MSTQTLAPLMMTVAEFARMHSISEKTVRECINGTSPSFPPLAAKRARKSGSAKSLIFITSEAAAEWRALLPDA